MKVGVIGTGYWGEQHARCYSNLGCDVHLWNRTTSKAVKIAQKYRVTTHESLDDLLSNCNAVSITTSSDTHYGFVKKCLEAGKHVLCAKPLALSFDEARELVNLAKRRGVVLQGGYVFRYTDAMDRLRVHGIPQDTIYVNMSFANSKPPRKDSDIISNLAIHFLDVLSLVAGKPESLFCRYNETYGVVVLEFPTFTANLEVGCNCPEKERSIKVVGCREEIVYDFAQSQTEPLLKELDHFSYLIENKLKDEDDQLLPIKLCDLAKESNKEGRVVKV